MKMFEKKKDEDSSIVLSVMASDTFTDEIDMEPDEIFPSSRHCMSDLEEEESDLTSSVVLSKLVISEVCVTSSISITPVDEKKGCVSPNLRRDEEGALASSANKKRCIQDFFIHKQLGVSGSGEVVVFLATDHVSGDEVVLKRSSKSMVRGFEDPAKEIEIMKEIKALGGHPFICKFIDCFEDDEYTWNVVELAHKGDLLDRIVAEGKISEEKCKVIFKQILSALKWMHSNGFYHLDISPENVLFTKDDEVRLCDFGSTRRRGSIGECKFPQLKKNQVLGKFRYCAPEVYVSDFDPAGCDVYSAGIMLMTMLIGGCPYKFPFEHLDRTFRSLMTGKIEETLRLMGIKDLPSKDAIDFLKKMVCYVDKRSSIAELEVHPWLQVVPDIN